MKNCKVCGSSPLDIDCTSVTEYLGNSFQTTSIDCSNTYCWQSVDITQETSGALPDWDETCRLLEELWDHVNQ